MIASAFSLVSPNLPIGAFSYSEALEAAVENMEIKKDIFSQLDKICKVETILASNTSSLSVGSSRATSNTGPSQLLTRRM